VELLADARAELARTRRVVERLELARLRRELAEQAELGAQRGAAGIGHVPDVHALGSGDDLDLGVGGANTGEGIAQDVLAEGIESAAHRGGRRMGEREEISKANVAW
jgi:hypothetical protein